MGVDKAVLKCLAKNAVFTGPARVRALWGGMTLCLFALVLSLAALAMPTGLAAAGLLAIAVLSAPALGAMKRRL